MSLTGIPSQNNIAPLTRRQWRSEAAAALSAAGDEQLGYDLVTCGDKTRPGAIIYCDNCGNTRAITYTCHSRLCPDCETRAQAQRLEKYLPIIAAATHYRERGYGFRHVTITTNLSLLDPDINAKSAEAWRIAKRTLDAVIYRQLKYLKLLTAEEERRKLPNWKLHRIGAFAGGEYGERGGKFHMHFFIYSPFLLHEWLVEELLKASDGRWHNVDIKAKNSAEDAKEIVAKYATKLTALPPALLPKLQAAIKGQRRIRNYGIWYGVPNELEEELFGCKECGNKLRFEAAVSMLDWLAVLEDPDAWYVWRHGDTSLLILKHGNKSREIAPKPPDRPWLHLL